MTGGSCLTGGRPLDADLGDALARGELGPVPTDLAGFEEAFVAVVESSQADPGRAWDGFYDRTLTRVLAGWGADAPGEGTVAVFTRIWTRAAALSRGTWALDVGTCFGLLPLAWALQPAAPRLLALDLCHQSAALAARQARRLGAPVGVVRADGSRLPLGDRAVGTVLLMHVLEHLPPALGDAVLAEALRVADERVVVAVPVEDVPDPLYGHVRVFTPRSLNALGSRTGWRCATTDQDGALLILDRPLRRPSCPST